MPQLLLLLSLLPPLGLLPSAPLLLLLLFPQPPLLLRGTVGGAIVRSLYVSLQLRGIAQLTPRRERGVLGGGVGSHLGLLLRLVGARILGARRGGDVRQHGLWLRLARNLARNLCFGSLIRPVIQGGQAATRPHGVRLPFGPGLTAARPHLLPRPRRRVSRGCPRGLRA